MIIMSIINIIIVVVYYVIYLFILLELNCEICRTKRSREQAGLDTSNR